MLWYKECFTTEEKQQQQTITHVEIFFISYKYSRSLSIMLQTTFILPIITTTTPAIFFVVLHCVKPKSKPPHNYRSREMKSKAMEKSEDEKGD